MQKTICNESIILNFEESEAGNGLDIKFSPNTLSNRSETKLALEFLQKAYAVAESKDIPTSRHKGQRVNVALYLPRVGQLNQDVVEKVAKKLELDLEALKSADASVRVVFLAMKDMNDIASRLNATIGGCDPENGTQPTSLGFLSADDIKKFADARLVDLDREYGLKR